MRFLHTSDWHIGRTARGRSRRDEHERALQQVLDYARDHEVDCLLVSGDVFDSSAPSPEAEFVVFNFFRELHGAGIPAVVIAGNHDHPTRFDALASLLRALRIYLVGRPVSAADGAVIELPSRRGDEVALIAALPWVEERNAVDFARLQDEPGASLAQYADRVADAIKSLAASFRTDTCNLMLAHVLVDNAMVGPGGGERELHMNMGIYGLSPQLLPPSEPQYLALGHVHRPQPVRKSPAAFYSGSLLQLDFGEVTQDKSVNLVEVHPRRPAEVTPLPITSGRALLDVGAPSKGILLSDLPAYAEKAGDAWLRVFVRADMPVANLPNLVREALPNAVHIERVNSGAGAEEARAASAGLGPIEMFEAFYRSELGRGHEPAKPTMDMFRRLLEEETNAAPQA